MKNIDESFDSLPVIKGDRVVTVSGDASLLCDSDLVCRKLLLYTTTEVKCSGVCHSVT